MGRVKSLERKYFSIRNNCEQIWKSRILKQNFNPNGYLVINLNKNNKRKIFRVHRLVANAFINNYENKPCIDHIDTNKSNNCISNLRWCTQKENVNNEITKENHKKAMKIIKDIADKNRAKAIESNKKKIKCITTEEIFDSMKEACNKYKLKSGNLSKCCKGERNYCGKLPDGTKLEWKYLND